MHLNFETAYIQYESYIEIRQKYQSKRSLKERFKNYILPFFKDYNIYDITEIDYIKFQSIIDNQIKSYNLKRNIHYLLVSFFKYCITFYNLDKNVAKNVGCFKKKETDIVQHDFYNIFEFRRFIKKVIDMVYKYFFYCLFVTGLRPGECMALQFIKLEGRILTINATIDEHFSKEFGCRVINSPKTLKSNRQILIPKKLERYILKLKKYYTKKYGYFDKNFYIFGGIKPLSVTTVNRKKIEACKRANIRPIKLHEFRHSHATLLVQKKVMINEVARRLGHSDVSITLNTYTHTDLKQEKRVIKTLKFLRL